jgi:hypothetical protein
MKDVEKVNNIGVMGIIFKKLFQISLRGLLGKRNG